MLLKDRGVAFQDERGSERSSACFHDICVLPGGRWLCAFRASPRKQDTFPQRVLLTVSDDTGASWSEPAEPFPQRRVDGRPGAWRGAHLTPLGGGRLVAVVYWVDTSDESLPFYNEETEGLLDSRIFLSFSDDSGKTWSGLELADTSPYSIPTPMTGPILLLPNGEWGLQFETNKPYYDTSEWHHESVLMFSGDQGRSWPSHAVTAADPEARVFYWDQRLGVLADSALLALYWTFDRRDAVYRNIHARRSQDSGRSWSSLWDTGIPGQPGPPASLPDGRIAMPYVDREASPILKLRVSADGGRSWADETEVILDDSLAVAQQVRKSDMNEAWSEMGAFSLGLPRTAVLPDGDVLVAYYRGPEADHTGVHWERLCL